MLTGALLDQPMDIRGKQKQQQQAKEGEHGFQFGMIQAMHPEHTNFMSKEGSAGAYDLGELDQALILYLDGQDHAAAQEQKQTLNIFPSKPMHAVEPSNKDRDSLGTSTAGASKRPQEQAMEMGKAAKQALKRETSKKGAASCSSEQEGPKTPDPKTLRRLAQNREAARKSRLRKKAYIQQLESSRIKLSQLEQELQRARAQGGLFGGGAIIGDQGLPLGVGCISSEAVMFDMEYGRWLEEHHRLMCELRAAVQEQVPENELRMYVDNSLAHFDEMATLRSVAIRSDVFHIVSGMWKTPAERCFLWIGGFRPSDLIKIVLSHIEPLGEQQLLGIYRLQQSTQETEDALSQGLDALYQSLSDTVASDELGCPSNMANYMAQMALAVSKLSSLEDFVRQADNLPAADSPPAAPSPHRAAGRTVLPRHCRVLPPAPCAQFALARPSEAGAVIEHGWRREEKRMMELEVGNRKSVSCGLIAGL